jgi:hypothetical protein
VKRGSKAYLKSALKYYPGLAKEITEGHRFDTWVGLATMRINQLIDSKYIRNIHALEKFMRDAANAYANRELARLGKVTKQKQDEDLLEALIKDAGFSSELK